MRLLFGMAACAFAIDQISKFVVINVMELQRLGGINVVPPFLNFRYGENRGINFGLFDGGSDAARWILIGIALIISIGVLFWVSRSPMRPAAQAAAGLLIGGALANVLDRVLYGFVLDFLNMSCCGFNNPFVFNLADVFIFVGALGLAFLAPDERSRDKKGQ